MAKVSVDAVPVKRNIKSINLELSLEEARTLVMILRNVGGDTKPRKVSGKILNSLQEVPELVTKPCVSLIRCSSYGGLEFLTENVNEAFDG